MRRAVIMALVGGVALFPPAAGAKFGISKTRVSLTRYRPPDVALLGSTVAVEVTSDARTVTNAHLDLVRGRLEEALRAWDVVRVVDSPRAADDVVSVSIDALSARLRDSVRYEQKYVKIGERQEWDEKKKKNVTRDVYGYRREPVGEKLATGSIDARVRVRTSAGAREVDAGSRYDERFDEDDHLPSEALSEDALERRLVEQAAERAVAAVCFSPETVQAMLAVDGQLKAGNQLAQSGQFEQALSEWTRRSFKGDTEAARLHNVGVAHEAFAYRLPVDSPDHRRELEQAAESYRSARALDPGEKYFAEPIQRVETSMVYARAAADLVAERQRWAGKSRPAARGGPSGSGSSGSGEPARSEALELDGTARPAAATRNIGLKTTSGSASVSLEYKVLSGEPQIRLRVGYEDETGKPRVATLEVSLGESPGGWSSWRGELDAIRPRPARITDVKILVEGGAARVDRLAVRER